jgi:tetratricopeptide (TPR) repeat protein
MYNVAPVPTRRDLGQLWQVPTFLLGVVAVAALGFAHPVFRAVDCTSRNSLDRELAEARRALVANRPDAMRAVVIGEGILARDGERPGRAGEIHFLLGSAYAAAAARAPVDKSADQWQNARHHLERAAVLEVPDLDRPRLLYRLGKVWLQTGGDLRSAIDYLARSVDLGAEDPAEGYGLLTKAYLRLPVPDLRAALEANRRQLSLTTDDRDADLAPLRLLRGELLLRTGESEEARKVLARVPRGVAREVYARARYLRAESLQRDKLWSDAAPLWEETLSDAPAVVDADRARYCLGGCYAHLGRTDDAIRTWQMVMVLQGDSGQAAALNVARLLIGRADARAAFPCYEKALAHVMSPGEYHNGLVSLDEAREIFEDGCRSCLEPREFDHALRLARLYARIGAAPRVQELIGESAEEWARSLLKNRAQKNDPDQAKLPGEAKRRLHEAAGAFRARAKLAADRADEARWLRRSAICSVDCREYDLAVEALKRVLEVETAADVIGETWYRLAKIHEITGDRAKATAAYHKCIEYTSPFAFRARLALAQDEIRNLNWGDAVESLRQNLNLMRGAADEELYKTTLLALANALMQGEHPNYRLATVRLQELIDRYPADADTPANRRRLADCYRRLAAQEDQNLHNGMYLTDEAQLHYRDQRHLWMQKAAAHYQKLVDDLLAQPSSWPLTDKQQEVLRQAAFALAESRFELGEYAAAAKLYDELAARYPHQPDELDALKQETRCYWVQGDRAKAAETVHRLEQALKDVPDSALQGAKQAREEWQEWLRWAAKQ